MAEQGYTEMAFPFTGRLRKTIAPLRAVPKTVAQMEVRLFRLERAAEDIRINQGRMLARQNRELNTDNLQEYEFKVFSQFGEDGIIQRLVDAVSHPNKTFIEFGVENFVESNCRFLMQKDNWSGLVIDGSEDNVRAIRKSPRAWAHDLEAVCAFVTRENISGILRRYEKVDEVGILSIDLDGIDYYVWEELAWVNPQIMIAEYNSVFGPERAISVPYDPQFRRSEKHYSHLYFGCSLRALYNFATKRGYSLVGSTSAGVNAFFVRNDLIGGLKPLSVEEAYVESKFRESRSPEGQPTFLSGGRRLEVIRGLPVLNVETGEIEPL